jgi:hypothetical protein
MISNLQKNNPPLLTAPHCANSVVLLMFFVSAAVYAAANGIIQLPDTYRTPLSDMVHDSNKDWRTTPGEDNPWREDGEKLIIKPRIKVELFPSYKPDSSGNPVSNSLFQNEDEIEKPVSNIFEYTW